MEQNADSRIMRPAYLYADLTRYFIFMYTIWQQQPFDISSSNST